MWPIRTTAAATTSTVQARIVIGSDFPVVLRWEETELNVNR